MHYLYLPSAAEELIVRGRYDFVGAGETVWATEVWERYRNAGSPVQSWRSEWSGERGGRPFRVLAHSVISPEGMERLKVQVSVPPPAQMVTITMMADSVMVNENGVMSEVALPPGYG
ncbi:MAG: hypothetical protein ACRDIB_03990, partial [Ardenticatenaceae bacterium]